MIFLREQWKSAGGKEGPNTVSFAEVTFLSVKFQTFAIKEWNEVGYEVEYKNSLWPGYDFMLNKITVLHFFLSLQATLLDLTSCAIIF